MLREKLQQIPYKIVEVKSKLRILALVVPKSRNQATLATRDPGSGANGVTLFGRLVVALLYHPLRPIPRGMAFYIYVFLISTPILLYLYIRANDKALEQIPERALRFSPTRCLPKDVQETARRLEKAPVSIRDQIPPKTGRRYIVVGGVNIGSVCTDLCANFHRQASLADG
jgi:hypothetical protein